MKLAVRVRFMMSTPPKFGWQKLVPAASASIMFIASICSTALIMFSFISCYQQSGENGKIDIKQFSLKETEKWRKELLLNGEVGTPCEEDYMKWNTKNSESYYGLPAEISSKTYDINGDGKDDILLFFHAGESCTGGHEEGSDFVSLIYSSDREYLYNKNLRSKIESKIQYEFRIKTDTFARRAIFSINDFNRAISGDFQLWTDDDPDCCASHEGTFIYNPLTWKIELKEHVIH